MDANTQDTMPAGGLDPIVATIEANTNTYLLSFGLLPGAVVHDDGRGAWLSTDQGDGAFNAVVSARFDQTDLDDQIERVVATFRTVRRPFTWHIGPSTTPRDLGAALLRHGLRHDEDEPGMAVELAVMHDEGETTPGLTIETVCDARGLTEWTKLWLFALPTVFRDEMGGALLAHGLGDDLPWRYYIGRLDGRPVACSHLFLGAGAAGVHHVVTLPDVRRQGIGRAMTLAPLRDAYAQGYGVGVLTSSPESLGLYRSIGFKERCWFHRYVWSPDAAPSA